jgi:hypothetical protein
MTIAEAQRTANGYKSGFKQEIGLIPIWAYVLAVLIFVGMPLLFFGVVWPNEEGSGPGWLFRFVFPFVPATILAFLVLMIGYVNQDAGRRGMSRTAWTLIVVFVPNAIGFIIYFLLRNPIKTQCPKCATLVELRANYCPNCRHSFHPTCPQCKTSVAAADTFCANCGVKLEQQ